MERIRFLRCGDMIATFVRLNDTVNGSRVVAIDGVHHIKTLKEEYRVDWEKHQSDKPKGCVAIEVGDVINGHKITAIKLNPFLPFSTICETEDFEVDDTAGDRSLVTFVIEHTFKRSEEYI